MPIAAAATLSAEAWQCLLAGGDGVARHPLYGPLLAARDGGASFVIGRAAQSLDGFIATTSGASRWIGSAEDILHTHRLRALCDAVVVGAGTVRADDPKLTTRACAGPSPVRVVIDPGRRLPTRHRVFETDTPTLVLVATAGPARHGTAETLQLACDADGRLAPAAIVAALATRGLHRLLVEGGGRTLAAFLRAGALHRLHVTLAPLLLGGGIPALPLPPAPTPSDGMRLRWTPHVLGPDILLDIPFAPPDFAPPDFAPPDFAPPDFALPDRDP